MFALAVIATIVFGEALLALVVWACDGPFFWREFVMWNALILVFLLFMSGFLGVVYLWGMV